MGRRPRVGLALCVWCLVIFFVLSHVEASRPTPRVSYGKKVRNGSAEWFLIARINVGNGFIDCGSSLIRPDVIITAAHCVYASSTLPDNVFLVDPVTGLQLDDTRGVAVAVPKEWNDPSRLDFTGDLALVRLNRAVEKRDTVELAEEGWSSKRVVVLGMGLTEEGKHADKLHMIVVPVLSRRETIELMDQAVSMYGDDTIAKTRKMMPDQVSGDFEADHFGAGDERRDSCQGDSGGPALARFDRKGKRDLLVGIVSYGPSMYACGERGSFGLYTDVGVYGQFIKSALEEAGELGEQVWERLPQTRSH